MIKKLNTFFSILKKDMKNYYLKPPNISWGIIFPISWTLMFFLHSFENINIIEILPGIISLSILFGTTSMLAVTITFERKSRSFERLLLAPISLNLLMLSKTTGAILFGIANATVPIIFASILTNLSNVNWFLLFIGIILIAITSTFLGLFIAVSVKEVFEAQTFSNFFRFPMMFLCGLFIPISSLPKFIQPISYSLPLTYGVDILKKSVYQESTLSIWISLIVLLAFSLVLFSISTYNIKKKWIY